MDEGRLLYMNNYSVALVTLGCAKNQVDSSQMARRIAAAGFLLCEDPSAADVVVVNTCSFIQPAVEESIATIFELLDLPNFTEGNAQLVVAGCLPARYGTELQDSLTEAHAFLPCLDEKYIVTIIKEILGLLDDEEDCGDEDQPCSGNCAACGHASLVDMPVPSCANLSAQCPELLTQPDEGPYSAFVKISEGCNRFCAFCMIPFIRGRYHSFPLEDIDAQVCAEIEHGAQEIVLIAQDTGRWGDDFEEPSSTAVLLDTLATRHPDTWFRIMYMEPEGVCDELLQTMASHDNICSYLDVPIQHSNADVLKAMNRRGSYDEFLAMYKNMRRIVPDITIRTTLIAGFPGETQEQFEELCEFLEEAELDYVGVFPYSAEEGTNAAKMPESIDEEEKIYRARTLREIADSISIAKVSARVGKQADVLILGREEDGQLVGRAKCQAPEVDGGVFLSEGKPGEIRSVIIGDSLLYEMEAE